MLFFLFTFILCAVILSNINKKLLYNDLFWLSMSWIFIIGTNLFSGVGWSYETSIEVYVFIAICFVSYVLGRRLSFARMPRRIFLQETNNNKIKLYILVGYIGLLLFVADYIRLNGVNAIQKSSYEISIFGSVGSLFIPVLLVQGLYLISEKLDRKGTISVGGVLLLLSYSVPCILNSGRESFLYVAIGFLVIYSYKKRDSKLDLHRFNLKKAGMTVVFILISVCLLGVIINISIGRYSNTQVSTFLATHDVSEKTIEEANKWGAFSNIYYNLLSYFGHQIPFLNFILKEYRGPYLFGMYEFNIISRRLPSFLGLDYRLVGQQLRVLFIKTGASFSGSWQTGLGSLVIDFSKYTTPIILEA